MRWMTAFIDLPAAGYAEAEAFWLRALPGRLSQRRGPFVTVLPETGDPYIRLQKVAEGPGGVHLDLEAPKAEELGATVRHREPGLVVLESPGGFPFCAVDPAGESAVPFSEQHRMDQVCLDIPPGLYDREVGFWAALTGRAVETNDSPEFLSLAGEPLRLLLQRLDRAEEGDRVTAHLDFACADREALAAEHESLGAEIVKRHRAWIVMRAPGGHLYCLTERDPYPAGT